MLFHHKCEYEILRKILDIIYKHLLRIYYGTLKPEMVGHQIPYPMKNLTTCRVVIVHRMG